MEATDLPAEPKTKEELMSELRNHLKLRNLMGGALYWNVVNDECIEMAKKCLSLGADRQEIEKIFNGGWRKEGEFDD